jgi:hypothetical protein
MSYGFTGEQFGSSYDVDLGKLYTVRHGAGNVPTDIPQLMR